MMDILALPFEAEIEGHEIGGKEVLACRRFGRKKIHGFFVR